MKIEVKHLTKKFKDNVVLKDINLEFNSGNSYGIYGRNGSGKSVFLKVLCTFYLPSSGEVLYDGVNLNSKNEFPKNFGVLIEKPSFFGNLTGYENLKYLAQIQKKIEDKEILEALSVVNLIEEKDKKYSKYSLGMKQKLGIAQAIMENPDVIILDEPFNGIERETVTKIINYLNNKVKDGKLVILSSHIKEDLENSAQNFIYFENGEVTNDTNFTQNKDTASKI